MPAIRFEFDDRALMAKLDGALPAAADAIEKALKPVARAMATAAQSSALAHIRYEGTKPGQYLASIYGGTFKSPGVVGGYVRSGNPLAHLLEFGAHPPPHEILPSAADVLAFLDGFYQVFAKSVHSPGATIPAYPALRPAFEGAEGDIRSAIEQAAHTL